MHSPTSEPAGGLGGSLGPGIRQTRLLARALRLGWDLPEDLKPQIIARLMAVLKTPGLSPREVCSATAGLLAVLRAEHDAIALTLAVEEHELFKDRLEAVEGKLADHDDRDRR